jgi:DNA-binding transcriptional ArsR family regulator
MRIEPTNAIPRTPSDSAESEPRQTAVEDEISFDWGALVLHAVHPAKVAIMEAMLRLQEPLSATRLAKVLGGSGYSLGVVSHHLQGLARWGAVELVKVRQVGGVIEKIYFIPAGEHGI